MKPFDAICRLVNPGGLSARLSKPELAVLTVMIRHSDIHGITFVGAGWIAECLGVTDVRTIERLRNSLLVHEAIAVHSRPPGKAVRYRLTIPTVGPVALPDRRATGPTPVGPEPLRAKSARRGKSGARVGVNDGARRATSPHEERMKIEEEEKDGGVQEKKNENASAPKARKSLSKRPAYTLPPSLDLPAVRAAMEEWIDHKIEKKDPLTELAARKLVKRLEAMGPERAVIAIDGSIEAQWKGVFEREKRSSDTRSDHADYRSELAPVDDHQTAEEAMEFMKSIVPVGPAKNRRGEHT